MHLNGSNNDDLNLPPLETNQPSLNSNGQSSTTVLFYQQRDFEESLDADVSDFITGELYLFFYLKTMKNRLNIQKGEMKDIFNKALFKRIFVDLT